MAAGRRALLVALTALVSLALLFVAGETLSRAFDLVDRVNGFPRRLYVATDDPDLPYVMRPGIDTAIRGVRVSVNSLGMRGPEVTPLPPPAAHRVLALGDSATFGRELAVEQAFPALLERELRVRTGGRWEVINGGVEGYNTAAELAFLRRRGLALRPETVVVGFNMNDFDYAPVMGPLGVLTSNHRERMSTWSFANLSEFYLLIRWLLTNRGQPRVDAEAAPGPEEMAERFRQLDRALAAHRKRYYRQPTDGRWQVMVDALGGLAETARAHGLRLAVAIIPDGDQVGVPEPDLTPQQKLLAVCRQVVLDCIDLHPAFASAAGENLFFDTMHPNAAGQVIIARVVADHLLASEGRGDGRAR